MRPLNLFSDKALQAKMVYFFSFHFLLLNINCNLVYNSYCFQRSEKNGQPAAVEDSYSDLLTYIFFFITDT